MNLFNNEFIKTAIEETTESVKVSRRTNNCYNDQNYHLEFECK